MNKVLAIITTRDRPTLVGFLLSSLLSVEPKTDVWILEGGSLDPYKDKYFTELRNLFALQGRKLAILPNKKKLKSKALAFGFGLLSGQFKGEYDYVIPLDDDTILHADALWQLWKVLEENKGMQIVGGLRPVVTRKNNPKRCLTGHSITNKEAMYLYEKKELVTLSDFYHGGTMMMRVSFIEEHSKDWNIVEFTDDRYISDKFPKPLHLNTGAIFYHLTSPEIGSYYEDEYMKRFKSNHFWTL